MKNTIQNLAASLFIACVAVLTFVSILGVWSVFAKDVITKSFETVGLLGVVALIVVIASNYLGDPSAASMTPALPRPGFRAMRNATIAVLIVSAAILALLGVLSIWDVITNVTVLHKSISSLAILAFAALVVVLVCLEREKSSLWQQRGREITGGTVIMGVILIWLLISFL